jgi:thiol-disulfide isomerase/thioredoxin
MNRRIALTALLLGLACEPASASPQPTEDVPVMAQRVITAPEVKAPESESPAETPPDKAGALAKVDLKTIDGPLAEQLTVQAAKAIRAGKRPFVEMRANWCPICKRVDGKLRKPELASELDDVVLIRVDTDIFASELSGAGLTSKTIPAFYELDRRGKPTDHWVNGHRWGPRADVPAKLKAFFAGE